MPPYLILVLIISFVASLVRSTFGFGESLVAVPLFLLFLPAEVAVPLSVLLSIVIATIIIIQDHTKIHFISAKWLILFALPGIPVGIAILFYGSAFMIKAGLGALIIVYSVYALTKRHKKTLTKDSMFWLFVCGFLSGIFGGAYGLNGPPLVVYGNKRQWSAKHFRATLQAYFLPVSIITATGYYGKGFINTEVGEYFLIALITAIPAVFLGRYLNHHLKDNSFFRYIYAGLILLGLILITSALR